MAEPSGSGDSSPILLLVRSSRFCGDAEFYSSGRFLRAERFAEREQRLQNRDGCKRHEGRSRPVRYRRHSLRRHDHVGHIDVGGYKRRQRQHREELRRAPHSGGLGRWYGYLEYSRQHGGDAFREFSGVHDRRFRRRVLHVGRRRRRDQFRRRQRDKLRLAHHMVFQYERHQ